MRFVRNEPPLRGGRPMIANRCCRFLTLMGETHVERMNLRLFKAIETICLPAPLMISTSSGVTVGLRGKRSRLTHLGAPLNIRLKATGRKILVSNQRVGGRLEEKSSQPLVQANQVLLLLLY